MSHPAYGRVAVAEPPANLGSFVFHDGVTVLKAVDHETPIAVLDQSDLIAQGIHTSKFIPGCKTDADALGSCTANTWVEAIASILPQTPFLAACKLVIHSSYAESPVSYTSAHALERAAIAFYHRCTDQTGNPSEQWPPEDCGSNGVYVAKESQALNITTGQQVASASNLITLLQGGGVMTGSPFFYSWEEPDAYGFIDGKGRPGDLEAAIASGLAGGHEFYTSAVEKLAILPTGKVDPLNTILRHRNHWTKSWGDHGCFRSHLSTWLHLGSQCDHRRLVIA